MISLGSTSSGPRGYTTQSLYLGCGAIARIKEEKAQDMERKGDSWGPFPEEDGKVVATLAGTLVGHLIQAYHAGLPFNPRDEISWGQTSLEGSHPETLAEARRIYRWYLENVAPEKWGRYSGHEVPVVIPEAAYGHRFTGAIDLLTEEDGREWINDFKLLGREDKHHAEKYGIRHQAFLYARARQLEGHEIAGVRYLTIIRTKEPRLINLEFPGLEEERLRFIDNFFETVKAKRANPRPEPSESSCLAYGRRCSLLGDDGICALL